MVANENMKRACLLSNDVVNRMADDAKKLRDSMPKWIMELDAKASSAKVVVSEESQSRMQQMMELAIEGARLAEEQKVEWERITGLFKKSGSA
jgi:hypothetical protein